MQGRGEASPRSTRAQPAMSRSTTAPTASSSRASRRRSRLHLAHGLTSPASFVADGPLHRRRLRPQSPRGATCLHNARTREHPLRTPASTAMPTDAATRALPCYLLAKKLALHGFARTVFATLAPSRDQAPPPRAAPRSRPAPPRNASGENAAAGLLPWRAETCEPIFRREHHRTRPVAPRLTKRILDTAIVSLR